MSFRNFLDECEDFELAFIVKYKINSYLPDTRKKIIDYVQERGLSAEDVEELINNNSWKTTDINKCPRCGSSKIQKTINPKKNTTKAEALDGLMGKETYINSYLCNICDYKSPLNEEKFKGLLNWLILLVNRLYKSLRKHRTV